MLFPELFANLKTTVIDFRGWNNENRNNIIFNTAYFLSFKRLQLFLLREEWVGGRAYEILDPPEEGGLIRAFSVKEGRG